MRGLELSSVVSGKVEALSLTGMTQREIGRTLSISLLSVSRTVKRISRKVALVLHRFPATNPSAFISRNQSISSFKCSYSINKHV